MGRKVYEVPALSKAGGFRKDTGFQARAARAQGPPASGLVVR